MASIGNAFQTTCILVGVGVAAILINSAVITHIGRRRVFLVSGLLLCGLAQLFTAVVYTVQPGTESTGKAIVGLAVVYILAYNVSSLNPAASPLLYGRIVLASSLGTVVLTWN